MKFDRNTVLGWVFLAVLFFIFFWYNNNQQQKLAEIKKHIEDSIRLVSIQKNKEIKDLKINSIKENPKSTSIPTSEEIYSLENQDIKIIFSNLGGQIKKVILKKYHFKNQPVVLGNDNIFNYSFYDGLNKSNTNNQVYFTAKKDSFKNNIQFDYTTSSGKTISQIYTLENTGYKILFNIIIPDNSSLLNGNTQFNWTVYNSQQEPGLSYEKQQTNFSFLEKNDDFDYFDGNKNYTTENPLKWISLSQQFFNITLLLPTSNNTSVANIQFQKYENDTSKLISKLQTSFSLQTPNNTNSSLEFSYLFAPNDLSYLQSQGNHLAKIINYGRGIYAFVRGINVYVLDPFFTFISKYVSGLGWCVLILTIFIKIITAPLTYSGYVSSAKMRVLKPDIDALKQKFSGNQQSFAMEQMKLFREAGVNPLSGCVPALLIIPIFGSLFNFFNSNIILRGKPFLWAEDLSSYDSILNFNFNIPFYGDHVSLFTLLSTITMFLSSMYSMSSQPVTQDNPAFKYMPYIFPFFMLFFFNSTPASLTLYYTVANIFTILIQIVIQKYIIDHDKILQKINVKRKAPKKKSMWQERYEKMLETQKNIERLKQKNKK